MIEQLELLDGSGLGLSLLVNHLLPTLAGRHPCIFITARELPNALLPARTLRHDAYTMRLAPEDLFTLADAAGATLSGSVLRRALSLLGGQADSLYSLIRVVAQLGEAPTSRLINRAVSADDLLARSARLRLEVEGPETRAALILGARLGYVHSSLVDATGIDGIASAAAWLLPLTDGWARLRNPWQSALPVSLSGSNAGQAATLLRAADRLSQTGGLTAAIPIYLDLGAHEQAAALIGGTIETSMTLGQHVTLSDWIDRLSPAVLQSWPWLLYAQGELKAAARDPAQARRSFAVAASSFSAHNDDGGLCQSLLAEGAMALWQGDHSLASNRTFAALAHAEESGLAWHMAWAVWQLMGISLDEKDLANARIYLERALQATTATGEEALADLLRTLELLLVRQRALGERHEFHRQALLTLEQAEHELSGRLHQLVSTPLHNYHQLSAGHSWADTPLMLKLASRNLAAPMVEPGRAGLWQGVARMLGLLRRAAPNAPEPAPAPAPPPRTLALEAFQLPPLPPFTAETSAVPADHLLVSAQETTDAYKAPAQLMTRPAVTPTLSAHLLGPFRVSLGADVIESWPSGRGRSLLKYLLVRRDKPASRDLLMDLFWPDSPPEDSRNSLNVAIHGLRQALRPFSDLPVVIYRRDDATYRLNPALQVWLDVEEFDRHVQAGRRCEAERQLTPAVASYEQAASLYQGDFLADDPYDEWPALQREQMRLAYLDTLDRLGQIYFSQGQYAACANLCQMILARDSCREDAHCRLMRCYYRQGQQHLALRQYQACVRALEFDLGVEPMPNTTQLAERIRRREQI